MPSYRYYRLHGLSIPGGYLEVSEFQLTASGARVAGASLTATDAPTGDLANFDDASTSTRCYWPDSVAEASGFYVQWDFGSATSVDGCRFAGFDTSDRYPSGFSVSGSDDASTWFLLGQQSGVAYPGHQSFTTVFALADPAAISGTVLDAGGSPCARTVRLHRRDTGAVLGETTSNATTGEYSIASGYAGECYVVFLDDDAGTDFNALIVDRVTAV
jgi:hypothetical protein